MKKLILVIFIASVLHACGGKQNTEENTLTEEQESQMVDEASEDLNDRVNDISNQADSLNLAVDSLLNTLNQ
jgi:hypothetical protein